MINWNQMSEEQLRIIVGNDKEADKILAARKKKQVVWYQKLVIDGHTFYIDKPGIKPRRAGFMGFGGRHFEIMNLETGEIVETNDLWHRDETTEESNAVFLPEKPHWPLLPQPGDDWEIYPTGQHEIEDATKRYLESIAQLPKLATYWGKLWREIILQTKELHITMLEVRVSRTVAITKSWERMRVED